MSLIYFYDASELDKRQLEDGLKSTDHRWNYVEESISLDNLDAETEVISVFVTSKVGDIEHPPRTIFCSTMECTKAFGFTSNGAYTVGTFGVAISYRGWKPYFVRHELIHHLQNERLGTLNAWLLKPKWFTEGMAYSMSEDPRNPLPQPLQGWRDSFERWRESINEKNFWLAAEAVNEH